MSCMKNHKTHTIFDDFLKSFWDQRNWKFGENTPKEMENCQIHWNCSIEVHRSDKNPKN